MPITEQEITAHLLTLLDQLASDWEYSDLITTDTLLFSDLGFQSLDAVILGNTLQEQYRHPIPYADLLAEIGARPIHDVSVGEWVAFTHQHLHMTPAGAQL